MMPIAIKCDLRTRAVSLQFTNPDRFLTAEHALASGLITSLELKELQREVRALGMEVAQ